MIGLKSPTFIVDEKKCRHNIERFVQKAKLHKLLFRPHFKTHQSISVGEWFRDCGVSSITVSSVQMAKYFAASNWLDITIAMPVNTLQINTINELASDINLNLLVISRETFDLIDSKLRHPVGVFIEIDNGYNRTGLLPTELKQIDSLIKAFQINPYLTFKGFLTHAGNTYTARNTNQVSIIHEDALKKLRSLKELYSHLGEIINSYGDTPSCSLMDNFEGINEIRPGNFVFYDAMQEQIGSCGFEDVAAVLAVPVLAKHQTRNEIVVEGGAIHLSKDYITDSNNRIIYGYPVFFDGNTWSMPDGESFVRSLSQEHGVIKCTSDFYKCVNVGDIIGIIPVHSCLTAHQMRTYRTLSGTKLNTMNS